MPRVSVVIPCYNQGHFVDEAVDSVLGQSFVDSEIIIVNDGSTDGYTNRLLEDYPPERARVLTTTNQGLAAARNNGIAAARGEYILPLDADDRIMPGYLAEAVAELDNDPQTGIVYCRAGLFGAVETDWNLPDYSLERMLVDNVIFCSALFRREDWLAVGGYDPGMIYGWEDYDFWLSLIERGRRVVRLPGRYFLYRVASDSMVRSKEKWQKVEMFKRIFQRHQQFFAEHIEIWLDALLETRDRYYTSRLYIDCGRGISDRSSVGRKVDRGTRQIIFDVSDFQPITALRFDPVDTRAVVAIDRITASFRDGRTKELSVTGLKTNALYREADTLLFDTNDPQCFLAGLEGGQLHHLARLTVELRFLALEDEALQNILEYQKMLLQKGASAGGFRKILEGKKLRSLLSKIPGRDIKGS